MIPLTAHQRQVAEYLAEGLSVIELSAQMQFTRSRGQELVATLRNKGVLSAALPEGCVGRVGHPADSRRNPFPREARYARLLVENTPSVLVVRSAVLPREDGRALPHAVPDECSVVLSYPQFSRWSFAAPRGELWSLTRTRRMYDGWTSWLAGCGGTLPPLAAPAEYQLTQVIAWAVGVEAILYDPSRPEAAPATQPVVAG